MRNATYTRVPRAFEDNHRKRSQPSSTERRMGTTQKVSFNYEVHEIKKEGQDRQNQIPKDATKKNLN